MRIGIQYKKHLKILDKESFMMTEDHLQTKYIKMDGGRDNPPIGYHRWHAYIRALTFLGGDEKIWLKIQISL